MAPQDDGPSTPLNLLDVPKMIQDIKKDLETVREKREKAAFLECLKNCDVKQDSAWNEELREKLDIEMSRSNFNAIMNKPARKAVFQEYQKALSNEPERDLAKEMDNFITGLDVKISNTISELGSNLKNQFFEDKQIKEENKLLIEHLGQFNLELSVRALLRKVCSADKKDAMTDAEAKQLLQLLGEEMLRKSFKHPEKPSKGGESCGPFFGQIVKNGWKDTADLVLDSMIIEKRGKDGSTKWDVHFEVLEEEEISKDYHWPTHTLFQHLATRSHRLVNHDLCTLFTNQKLQKYKNWCYISAASYLIATFCLTYTLVTSVMADNVQEYNSGLDYSRAVFEVVSAICVFMCLLLEVLQIIWGRYLYFTDFGNLQELSSAFLLCLTVPLRFGAEECHWYIFAIGYFIWISLTYKQSILIKELYLRAEIFVQVIKQDVVWFVILFLVINLAFCGASFLTLRGDNDLHVDNQTSSAPAWFFMGMRTLAEGQPVLEYAGNGEYSPVSTIVFVLFLFVTCVILLNLLIAQLGQTLENVSESLDKNYNAKLAHTLAWMEINTTHFCCSKVDKPVLLQTIPEEEYTEQLFQPVNASDKILEKTNRLEERYDKIGKDLEVVKSALDVPKNLEKAIGDIKTTLSQSLTDFVLFPGKVNDTLNDLKKKVEERLAGRGKATKQKDKADAKPPGEKIEMDAVDASTKRQQIEDMERDWPKKLQGEPQEKVLGFLESCWLNDCNPAKWKIKTQSPLLVAVERGFYHVVNKLLGLLHQVEEDHFPTKLEALRKALHKKYDQTAALIVKDMYREDPNKLRAKLREIFIAQKEKTDAAVPDKTDNAVTDTTEDAIPGTAEDVVPIMEKTPVPNTTEAVIPRLNNDNYLSFWLAVMDILSTDEDLELFEVVEQERGRSVFDLLTDWAHWEIFSHPVVQSLVEKKWVYCNRRCQFIFECAIYLITLGCLTALVVTSGMAEDVTSYHSFQARHLFEVLAMILLLFSLVKEILELKREGFRLYFADNFNRVEFSTSILLLIAIPLRYAPSQFHWYLFAVGYFVWVMILFKYAILSREFGTYAQSLWIILCTDVVFFLVLFAVVDLAFSGTLYLILRGDSSLSLHTETSTWWGTLFVGLRALTDGQNSLEYYGGEDEFKSFQSVATIVVFLFVVIVLLANILIAQLSNTYTNIQEKSLGATWARKAHTICRLQRASWLNVLIKPKESKESQIREDFISSLPSETNILVQIDKNVANLSKKLPAIEANIVGVKAQAERCQKSLARAESQFKQGLDYHMMEQIDTLASRLVELETTIEDKCEDIKAKIDKYTSTVKVNLQEISQGTRSRRNSV